MISQNNHDIEFKRKVFPNYLKESFAKLICDICLYTNIDHDHYRNVFKNSQTYWSK